MDNDQELKTYPIKLNAHSIELEIDTNGNVTKASILKVHPLERVTSIELTKELNSRFNWVPAYLYGQKVRGTYLIK
jgi:hypothetical protein